MTEPRPFDATKAMSRTGFVRNLALLAGAAAIAFLDLPGLLRRGPSRPRSGSGPSPTPPDRSVKRRG